MNANKTFTHVINIERSAYRVTGDRKSFTDSLGYSAYEIRERFPIILYLDDILSDSSMTSMTVYYEFY